MAAAKAMPSSSHGTATMRWSLQVAGVGQRYLTTVPSKVRSASNGATIFPLSHADLPLLQQPASAIFVCISGRSNTPLGMPSTRRTVAFAP